MINQPRSDARAVGLQDFSGHWLLTGVDAPRGKEFLKYFGASKIESQIADMFKYGKGMVRMVFKVKGDDIQKYFIQPAIKDPVMGLKVSVLLFLRRCVVVCIFSEASIRLYQYRRLKVSTQ